MRYLLKIIRTIIRLLTRTSFLKTLYFNFHYFPLKTALRLPVFIKCRSRCVFKGKVILKAEKIKTGMISLGLLHNPYYRGGIFFSNHGTLIFCGRALIGNESKLIIYPGGEITLGANVGISSSRILSVYSISIGKDTLIGNDCDIFDCDFHVIKDMVSGKYLKPYKKVVIGDTNWLGFETMVMKGTVTPNNCTVAARSILNKRYKYEDNCIIGGNPAQLIGEDYQRDDRLSCLPHNFKN